MKRSGTCRFLESFVRAGLALLLLLSTNCAREAKDDARTSDASTANTEKTPEHDIFEIGHPDQFPLVTVEQRHVPAEVKVTGVVAPDVERTVQVLSLVGGRAAELRVRLGDDVKKGQVMLLINSPEAATAFSEYQKSQADELFARRQLDRSQLLLSKGAIAKRDLDAAEDTEQKAKADLMTAAERIRILGADLNHPSPIVEVRAPSSGTIIEQNVTSGTGVRSIDNSPNLFTIADLSRVWVLCDVYENQLAQAHLGDLAEVRLNAYADQVLRGRVSNIARVLDPTTRTAKVRLEMDNSSRLMRIGMFATVTFHSPTAEPQPVVPATAVLRLHDKDWVFRSEGGRRFRRVEVQAGPLTDDGMQQISGGLSPGDKVVANALQFSNAAEAE